MKKFIFCLLLMFSIISFSEKTCNDTDFRQAMINYANAQVGKPYSMTGPRVGPTSFDCSGLMSASIKAGGMTSISGRNEDFGTTASGLVSRSKTLIPKNDFSNLKPGDMVHFSPYSSGTTGHVGIVVANLGNGKVEIVDARGKKYGVQRRVKNLSSDSHYLGATSATQILKNNGCTNIINSSGQVITPPAGSSTNSSERKTSFDPNKGTKGKTEQTLEINFNKISNRIVEYIVDGAKEYFPDLKILLSILFAFELYFFFYEGFSGANEKLWTAFGRKILKFGFYLAVLENYLNILVFMYNFFLGIAQEFVGDAALLKIFELDNSADGINLIFSIMGEAMIVLLKTLNNWGIGLFEPLDSFYRLILILIILGCMLIVTIRYLFEIFIVKTQFFLAGGLASIFLPFEVFEKTKEIGGSRTLRAVLGGGFLVTALAIVGTVSYDILKEYIVNEATTVDYLDLMRSFRFIMVCWIILKLMGSVREMLEKVMR